MAVFIKATYVKKLGLPQYSSHQYSVEVSAELTDLTQLPQASADLYARLQEAVDSQIVNPGFVPGDTSAPPAASRPSSAHPHTPSTPSHSPASSSQSGGDNDLWRCSDKQRDLILKIVAEHQLDKGDVDALARQRYSVGVKQLNKLQASGLIDELIETHGGPGNGRGRGNGGSERRGGGSYSRAYAGKGGRQ
jgi:hypothetical protein